MCAFLRAWFLLRLLTPYGVMGLIGFGTIRGMCQSQFFYSLNKRTKDISNENQRANY